MSQNETRKTLLARITKLGAELKVLAGQTVEKTWMLAQELVSLQATYPQGAEGAKAFYAAAATASGKGEATIRNLVRAVEVRENLTTAQRGKVGGWSYDMVLSLADKKMTGAQRTSLIGKVEKSGTRSPIEVRKLKREVVGTKKRERQSSAEATTKLAEKIREDVEKLLANGHDPVSIAAGCQLAREYSGDVAAAVLFVAANVKVPAKVVA